MLRILAALLRPVDAHLCAAKRTLISASAATAAVKIDLNCTRHPSQTPMIGGTRLSILNFFLAMIRLLQIGPEDSCMMTILRERRTLWHIPTQVYS